MSTLIAEIQELQGLSTAELAARYEALFGKPPRTRQRQFMLRRAAWKLQEQRLSPAARSCLEVLIAEIDREFAGRDLTVTACVKAPRAPRGLSRGTTLVRLYKASSGASPSSRRDSSWTQASSTGR